MKMRYWFMIIFLAIFVLSACNQESSKNNETDQDQKVNEETETNEESILTDSGFPIVKEPLTLHFMVGKPATTADDYSQVAIWKKYEEMTGITIDWELVPREGLAERRNLTLAGGEYPDVFYSALMPATDILKYGEQGVFIELNDLIEEHMPNLSQLLDEYPDIRKGITFPNGKIYSLPTILDPDFLSVLIGPKLWIREDWLEQLNMKVPETIDEFYEYLKAVKETDLNGNGENDEVPFGAYRVAGLQSWLYGSFGIGNRGGLNSYIDVDPETNEMRFWPLAEGYRDLLEYLNKLYSEGLIQENIYSIDINQYRAHGSEGIYGSVFDASPEISYGEVGENYIGLSALKGPTGEQKFYKIGSPLSGMGGFIISNQNEYPEASLRWMDYFYSDEGTKMFFMGIEGESYEEDEDGNVRYLEHITNNPDGLTQSQALMEYVTWSGGGYPGIVKQQYFQGAEARPSSIEAAEKIKPYIGEEIWPAFTYTEDENKRLAPLLGDIVKYVQEMSDKIITGSEPLSTWDEFESTLKRMGLDEYMEIQQQAYERYMNN